MKEEKKLSKIETIRLELKKKIFELENNKPKIVPEKVVKESNVKEKSLFELRKELQQIQSKTTINTDLTSANATNKAVKTKALKHKEVVTNTSSTKQPAIKHDVKTKEISNDGKNNEFKTSLDTKIKKNIKVTLNKPDNTSKTKKQKPDAKSINLMQNKIKNNKSKGVIAFAKSNVIFLIALFFAIIYFGYLVNLKFKIKKEREALELKKTEQIDYSKKDVMFKEVEEDLNQDDLQDIDTKTPK